MSTTKIVECESCGHPIGRGRLSCQNCGAAATARAGRVTPEWEKTEKAKKCLLSGHIDSCAREFHDMFERFRHFSVRTAGAFVNQVSVEYPFVDIAQFYKRAFGSEDYYGVYVNSETPKTGLSLSYVKTNGLHRMLIVQHGSMELSIFETSDVYLEAIEAVIKRADKIAQEKKKRDWKEKEKKYDLKLEAAQAKYGEERAAYAKLSWWKKRMTRPPKLVIE